ncbi:MAG TPA: ATP-dependent DNA helicase RecQ, partial [Kribbella sp.]
EVVVALPAAGHRQLTVAIAEHVAAVGRLDQAELTVDRSGFTDDLSSAEEAKVWRDGITVDGATAQAVTARTVLLLVDSTSSQWPVTVATAKLREAGAMAVLPLVIHKRP